MGVGVGAIHPVVQHRLQQWSAGVGLGPQALAGAGVGGAGHGHHGAGQALADQPELAAAVQAKGVGLFAARQRIFYVQHAAGYFQPAQAGAGILADFEHPCAEFAPGGGHPGQGLQTMQQAIQAVQPQGCAKKAGEHLPPRNSHQQSLAAGNTAGQHFLHQWFAAQGQGLGVRRGGEIHTAIPEPPTQLP